MFLNDKLAEKMINRKKKAFEQLKNELLNKPNKNIKLTILEDFKK